MKNILNNVNTWLIDLDNTVYSAQTNLFLKIHKRMKSFIASHLKISENEAFLLQKKYYLKYGTTLRGLMKNHNINPSLYLDYVHDINISKLASDPLLAKGLNKIDGKKIIFTNSSSGHANRILKQLGIHEQIDTVFDICAAGYIPKPSHTPYNKLILKYKIIPKNTIMIDDIPKNLETAKKLGIKTIWVSSENDQDKKTINFTNQYPYIDLKINDLTSFITSINP